VDGQRLSNTQSLIHTTVGHGPTWLFPQCPAILHGCTPLP